MRSRREQESDGDFCDPSCPPFLSQAKVLIVPWPFVRINNGLLDEPSARLRNFSLLSRIRDPRRHTATEREGEWMGRGTGRRERGGGCRVGTFLSRLKKISRVPIRVAGPNAHGLSSRVAGLSYFLVHGNSFRRLASARVLLPLERTRIIRTSSALIFIGLSVINAGGGAAGPPATGTAPSLTAVRRSRANAHEYAARYGLQCAY